MKIPIKTKLTSWLKRYLPSEIIGTVTAMIGAIMAFALTQNPIVAAFAGTWGENVGYYGTMLFREEQESRIQYTLKNKNYTFRSFLLDIRNIIFEFGPAEVLDSFFIRPFMMYFFPMLIGNLAIGILVGKIAADITFYIPAIVMYELKMWKKR